MRTGARSVREASNPYLFHVRASYDDETGKMVETLITMGFNRFGVLYQNDPFGKEGLAGIEVALARRGLKPDVRVSYEKNTTEVAAAVKAVAKADPQAVIMVSNTLASAAFVKTVREAGYQGQILAVSVTDPGQVFEKIGGEASHGLVVSQVMPNPERREIPVVKEAARALESGGTKGVKLNYTMLEGYIYAKVLVEGLRGAGSNPTRASLQTALSRLRGFDVGGLVFDYGDGRREGARFVDLTIIGRGGKLLQ
jgi:ABC-type branched-subunit amino acid transport system substrate-binding protein